MAVLEVAGVLDLTGHLLKGIHIAASDEYTTNGTVRMNWPLTTAPIMSAPVQLVPVGSSCLAGALLEAG